VNFKPLAASRATADYLALAAVALEPPYHLV